MNRSLRRMQGGVGPKIMRENKLSASTLLSYFSKKKQIKRYSGLKLVDIC